MKKIGIIICDRYKSCAGGKCFRALRNREGAFSIYKNEAIEVVGYTTCGGCPGGNIEYAIDEMVKNGATTVHFATGMIVGYPPCPHIKYFHDFIKTNWDIEVVHGTHPIPEKYLSNHKSLKTWKNAGFGKILKPVMANQQTRLDYN